MFLDCKFVELMSCNGYCNWQYNPCHIGSTTDIYSLISKQCFLHTVGTILNLCNGNIPLPFCCAESSSKLFWSLVVQCLFVCPCVLVKFSHFHLCSRNKWAKLFQPNFTQSILRWRKKFVQIKYIILQGLKSDRVKVYWQLLELFFSRINFT